MRVRRVLGPALAVSVFAVARPDARLQDPPLADLLGKSAEYVAAYRTKVSGAALDEMFLLTELGASQMRVPRRVASDVVLINISERLMSIRDPYAIDTRPTREPGLRIVNTLKEPTAVAWQRVQTFAQEGAYLLLANAVLWYSEPTLALRFIEAAHQPRMEYKLEGRKKLNNIQTTGIGFKEIRGEGKAYLLGTPSNPYASGRFWVDPATGAIHMTELWIQSDVDTARVQVSYAPDPGLGFLLPRDAAHSFQSRERGTGMTSMGAGGTDRRLAFEANAKYTNPRYTPIDLSKIYR